MKRVVGCFTNCFGADGVRAAADRLRATGLEYLELALRGHNFGGLVIPESAVITEKASDDEARAFVALLEQKVVRVCGCNVGGANILTPDGLDLTLRRIRFAKRWFGVPVVVSGAGQPSGDAERKTMVESLRTIGDTAATLGMTVALETHKGPTQNAAAMLALMGEVDHPHVLLNFDTGNINYYNRGADPLAELEKVKHLVRNVHLKDSRGAFEDWYFPAVGDGGFIDFRRVREVLDGVGFLGPYTVEIEGIQGEPEPGLDGRAERVARSARHLKACGYFD
jgi:inosose dehydratase